MTTPFNSIKDIQIDKSFFLFLEAHKMKGSIPYVYDSDRLFNLKEKKLDVASKIDPK